MSIAGADRAGDNKTSGVREQAMETVRQTLAALTESRKTTPAGGSTASGANAEAYDVEISDSARTANKASGAKQASDSANGSGEILAGLTPSSGSGKASVQTGHAIAAADPRLDSRSSRAELSKDYDGILKELRAQYGEAEALERFDAIMRADGWEPVEAGAPDVNGVSFSGGCDLTAPTFIHNDGGFTKNPLQCSMMAAGCSSLKAMANALSYAGRPERDVFSSVALYSSLTSRVGNGGEDQILAGSWATYSLLSPDHVRLAENWVGQNLDALSERSGLDLAAFVAANDPAGRFSPAAVNESLGSLVADIMDRSGFSLGSGENIVFGVVADADGVERVAASSSSRADGNDQAWQDFQQAFRQAMDGNPEWEQAFIDQYHAEPTPNLNGLSSEFQAETGMQVGLGQRRTFIYSADTPGTVVMGDSLAINNAERVYRKKVSDDFDATADYLDLRGQLSFYDLQHSPLGRDEWRAATYDMRSRLCEDVATALITGGKIASTVTAERYDAETCAAKQAYDALVAQFAALRENRNQARERVVVELPRTTLLPGW